MKQILLATALIALPVAAFTGFTMYQGGGTVSAATAAASAGLGDMSNFSTIIADVQSIAAKGDLKAAQVRITDFETAWDDSAAKLRALDGNAWGTIDDASDAALGALRAGTPDPAAVTTTLVALMTTLQSPTPSTGGAVAATLVSGVAVTDANGRAIPCEEMLTALRTGLTTAGLSDANKAAATDFQTKGTERCNADDDKHADEFSAQGIALTLAK